MNLTVETARRESIKAGAMMFLGHVRNTNATRLELTPLTHNVEGTRSAPQRETEFGDSDRCWNRTERGRLASEIRLATCTAYSLKLEPMFYLRSVVGTNIAAHVVA